MHATKRNQQLACTNKTLVVQIGGGFFSIAFAVRMLEVDCEFAVISNDSEVIAAAQRLPKPVTVLGALGQEVRDIPLLLEHEVEISSRRRGVVASWPLNPDFSKLGKSLYQSLLRNVPGNSTEEDLG